MDESESVPFIFKIVSSSIVDEDNFVCELRANINDEESFTVWLNNFSNITKTNWILRSSVSRENSSYDFSRDYVCQHSSFNKKTKKAVDVQKNKQCKASLKVRIKRNTKYTRCRDPYVKEGLCAILSIKFQHSHHINVAEAWGWLRRKDVTRQTFIEYFNNGLSPADAIHYHEDTLLVDGPETLADASVNPPKHWVYYLHNIWRKNEYGGASKGENFYNVADKRLCDLKNEGSITSIDKGPFKIISVSSLNFNFENGNKENISSNATSSDIATENCTLIENFEKEMQKIIDIVKSNSENESLMKAVKNLNPKFKNLNGPEAVTSFLHGISLGHRIKFGKNIHVQPTAIARRKCEARKGSKRIPAGRPLKDMPAAKRRKRCLASNINSNVPNAKGH